MIDELDALARARPEVPPVAGDVRTAARRQLHTAIETERSRARRDGAVWRVRARLVVSVVAVGVTVAVALGALLLLHHAPARTTKPAVHPSGVRGRIIANGGVVIASERRDIGVALRGDELAPAGAALNAELALLARSGVAADEVSSAVRAARRRPTTLVWVAVGISHRTASLTAAHAVQLPGVRLTSSFLRVYPRGSLAAQLIGWVGPIANGELHQARYAGVPSGAIVGQSGLEYTYDQALRQGNDVRISLDPALQRVGEQALATAIARNPPASGGAFVAINPQNGEIYAMGSAPTYDAGVFTRPISGAVVRTFRGPGSGNPLVNRAIASAGPVGSTFTPITALAALQSGAWSAAETFDDTGQLCLGAMCLHNAGHAAYGVVNLANAIRFSSDDFFYNLGARLNTDPTRHPNGGALRQWATALGIGEPTGVDLPGEASGLLPTPAWIAQRNALEQQCENASGLYSGKPKHPAAAGGCGIAVVPPEPWVIGDNVNVAVGQGDLQVTPLQLAVAYAAIANGGTIIRPHLGLDITSPNGTVQQQIATPPTRHVAINPGNLAAVRRGLRYGSSQLGGTSADVFSRFPKQVYGATGAAQYAGQQDYAWYAGYVPASATTKPIVVVVTVQQGGFGDVAAAPVARQILSQWFLDKPGPYVAGAAHTL